MKSVPRGYGTHADFMELVQESVVERTKLIGTALQDAFATCIHEENVETIHLADIDVHELADVILSNPMVLKPLLVAGNIAGRAIERDLGIANVNTYAPKLDERRASAIAGYLKPFLPATIAIPTLVALDRVEFVDKEIRAFKGRWERRVTKALSAESGTIFRKRRFDVDGESFEIDAAHPKRGDIAFAVDIKRIEARRDIHKRIDEIVNKAAKLARHNPDACFGTVIYFPFEDQHRQIQHRLETPHIHVVAFASETDQSVRDAAEKVVAAFAR